MIERYHVINYRSSKKYRYTRYLFTSLVLLLVSRFYHISATHAPQNRHGSACTVVRMPKEYDLHVRLSAVHKRKLDKLCEKLDLNPSAVMRLALSELADAKGIK